MRSWRRRSEVASDLPYVNSVRMPRRRSDWPRAVPEGATNLGPFAEVSQEVAFAIEYSARTAREAIHRLLRRGPAPPPVYQGQYDPAAQGCHDASNQLKLRS